MPGFELFGPEERKHIDDVMETGILMRYGFDGPRKGVWKSKELEAAICARLGCGYTQLTSSGTSALTTALACLGLRLADSDNAFLEVHLGPSKLANLPGPHARVQCDG